MLRRRRAELAPSCPVVREEVSAALDGEGLDLPPELVESHLSSCAACRAFAATAGELRRRFRLQPLERMPDLSLELLARADLADPGRRFPLARARWRRWAVPWAAVALPLALALPALSGQAPAAHQRAPWPGPSPCVALLRMGPGRS